MHNAFQETNVGPFFLSPLNATPRFAFVPLVSRESRSANGRSLSSFRRSASSIEL